MLPKSKFLSFFLDNKEWVTSSSELIGDMLLVERVKFPEKKIGSIIIADAKKYQHNSMAADEPTFFRVLHVGAGYYDDVTKESVPLDVNPGDIILTGAVSAKVFSSLPFVETTESDVLGVTRYGDIQWRFKGEEAFFKFLSGLNEAVKTKMEPGPG